MSARQRSPVNRSESVRGIRRDFNITHLARKLPRYPVPIALIGRLAVDSSFQGKGLGSILLVDACQKVVHAGTVLGVAGIVVDAKDAAAETFYRHFGFVPLPGRPDRLLLPAAALPS